MPELQSHTKSCFHCGDPCPNDHIYISEKFFCCQGCKTIFEILSNHNLQEYYNIENQPGVKYKEKVIFSDFAFLDLVEIKEQLLNYTIENSESVNFKIPSVHCSSCIFLLENIDRIHPGILRSEANFLKKEASFQFNPELISLRKLAELLDQLGYRPDIQLDEDDRRQIDKKRNMSYIYRLGIAGFAFGNIMLLSFPEYLSEGIYEDEMFGNFFGYINLILALPVFFYCSLPYFQSAAKGLKAHFLNIDVPISLGIIILFFRSTYDVLSLDGAGYFDSMTGLVFFLLIGRWFQNKTYQALSFERNYKSYFPLAITKVEGEKSDQVLLKNVKEGDHLLIRNGEIIPADSRLVSGKALIDYSFVTGESEPVELGNDEILFAGGRQIGIQLEIEVIRDFSQSYLMQLWKNENRLKDENKDMRRLIDRVSQYFTLSIILVAMATGFFWYLVDPEKIIHSITSVLIIACPCALALTIPFTFGNGIRLLEKAGLYLKDAKFIERLSEIDTIVFDKTGTITSQKIRRADYIGKELTTREKIAVKTLVVNSSHPLSKAIAGELEDSIVTKIHDFKEELGKGLSGEIENQEIKLGSVEFLGFDAEQNGTIVHLQIGNQYKGFFSIGNVYRDGLQTLVGNLKSRYNVEVITGDSDAERKNLERIFGKKSHFQFSMNPMEKRAYIEEKKLNGKRVLMIGDGLNDAGAIRESYVGISISDDIYGFLPSCDGILESESFNRLNNILKFTRQSKRFVWAGFLISFIYNFVGLYFAVQGFLSPVVAAILMPLSSITVVGTAILSTNISANRNKF